MIDVYQNYFSVWRAPYRLRSPTGAHGQCDCIRVITGAGACGEVHRPAQANLRL